MTKIMDVLDNVSGNTRTKARHEIDMQDEIAKTYFHSPSSKKAHKKKSKLKTRLPWFLAAFAFVVAAAIIMSRSSVDIKVRFLGEIPSFSESGASRIPEESPDKGAFLISGGDPNKDIIKNIHFGGDAKEFSIAKPEELVLCNARGSGWANYTIELKDPVDLNKLDIRYTAKGSKGDENLVIVIGDTSNRVYRLEKDLSSVLSKDWHRYTINFRRVQKAVDISNIAFIKFEFGSLTAGNHPSAVIFLKDIYIAKTRRLKWL